jgi:serine/threonine-protein kinase
LSQTLAGRYQILSLLGSGGMGTVYRARDLELDETVALKVLRRELVADARVLARFRQEVKLARKVTHRNVARMFDIGEHEGEKFLTMEFVEGESLAARLARAGVMPLAQVVEIADAICSGLAAAHAAGVVHRDLKPDNVLVGDDGRVVITDFGIARAILSDPASGVQTAGAPIGTPAYMAPEQVEGAQDIDARADIYALGAMLYELLTGDLAWDGDSVYSIAAKRLVLPPPDPRAKCADLPDAVARIVMRCMARRAPDRFAGASEVSAALAGLTLPASGAASGVPSAPARVLDAPESGAKTVAVLPFRNAGPSADDYLADGVTDDLIDSLSMASGLRVRSRGVVMGLKGIDRDPRELGAELGVQVVVEGSVRRAGDQLRVHARIVSVADGFQLWAKRFDRSAGDLLSVGDETASAVAEALTVGAVAPARVPPTDPVAIDLYLRARHEYHKGWRANALLSVDLFKQALERAPSDPTILAGYSMALMRSFSFDESVDPGAEGARRAAEQALAAAPHLGEPHVALATYGYNVGRASDAAREVARALANAPALADAHDACGKLLVEAGAPEEGIERLRVAIASEPRLMGARYAVGRTHALLGRRDASDEEFREEPADAGLANLYWFTRARIALWYAEKDRAREWLVRLSAREAVPPGVLSVLRLVLGEPVSKLERSHVDAQASAPGLLVRRRAFFNQLKAEIHMCTGEEDAALSALEAADAASLLDVTWLDCCPLFGPVRQSPRFRRVHAGVAERAAEVRDVLRAWVGTPKRDVRHLAGGGAAG